MDENKLISKIGDLIDKKLLSIKEQIGAVDKRLSKRLSGVKQDIGTLKQDVSGLKQDMSGVKQDIRGMKDQLNTVELKVEAVNAKIDKSQKETIEVLTDLIQAGYETHEQRIQKLEKHANLS